MAELITKENYVNFISRLLEHFRERPSRYVLSSIHTTLNSYGYTNIPTVKFLDSDNSILNKEEVDSYCNDILTIINKNNNKFDKLPQKKKNKEMLYIFPESHYLPKNVYVVDKNDEDNIDDNEQYDEDVSGSDSEEQLESEVDDIEVDVDVDDGYEIYDSDDSGDFSE